VVCVCGVCVCVVCVCVVCVCVWCVCVYVDMQTYTADTKIDGHI